MFSVGTPSQKPRTFAAKTSRQNRPAVLTAHPERDKTAGAIASATTWLFLSESLPSSCPPPLHQADRIMANRRDPVNLRRRGVSPHLATSLPTILSTPFA